MDLESLNILSTPLKCQVKIMFIGTTFERCSTGLDIWPPDHIVCQIGAGFRNINTMLSNFCGTVDRPCPFFMTKLKFS
jgi:hypothetical protein